MANESIERVQQKGFSATSAAFAVLIAVLAGSCDGDGVTETPASVAGDLAISMSGASVSASAVLIAVSGPSMGTLSASNPDILLRSMEVGGETRAVLLGEVGDGPLARFSVPDTSKWGEYDVDLLEMAAADYQLVSVSGINVSVAPER